MINAELEIMDLNSARLFHARRLDNSPQWHCAMLDHSGLYLVQDKADLCRTISRVVAGRDRWSLHVIRPGLRAAGRRPYDVYPDEMGGAILDNKYLGYAEWLREVIPDIAPISLDSEVA